MPRPVNLHRSVRTSAARLRSAAAAGRVHVPARDNDFLGLRSGDVLIWDDRAKPVTGDLILVESTKGAAGRGEIKPTIFLAFQAAREDGSNNGERGRPGEVCIIECTGLWEESHLDGRILGVVSHVIIPEVGIAALDLGLDGPDAAGPSFKVLIDCARLFGTLAKQL
ncbi:MAG TPA: hypothetical protein VEZ90_03325 [Blastocatellia bacterium]|nr:hypothetical protein [Blastocatellia bacterium]